MRKSSRQRRCRTNASSFVKLLNFSSFSLIGFGVLQKATKARNMSTSAAVKYGARSNLNPVSSTICCDSYSSLIWSLTLLLSYVVVSYLLLESLVLSYVTPSACLMLSLLSCFNIGAVLGFRIKRPANLLRVSRKHASACGTYLFMVSVAMYWSWIAWRWIVACAATWIETVVVWSSFFISTIGLLCF